MNETDWNHLIVISSLTGERYMGWIREEDPREYVAEKAKLNEPVEVSDARLLISQVQPNIGPGGRVLGFAKMVLLMPIDVLNGPLPTHNVLASSWYFPKDTGGTRRKFEELLRQAEESEQQLSAADAGLVTGTAINQRIQ